MEPSTLPACRRIIRFARPLKGLSGIDKHLVVRPAGQSRRYYSLGLRSEKKGTAQAACLPRQANCEFSSLSRALLPAIVPSTTALANQGFCTPSQQTKLRSREW